MRACRCKAEGCLQACAEARSLAEDGRKLPGMVGARNVSMSLLAHALCSEVLALTAP